MTDADQVAILLTLRLAVVVTALLLLLGAPLAWWLARGKSMARTLVGALVGLPLVLPPAVIGFYLLLLMGPAGALGKLMQALGAAPLPFTFGGLVVASVIYSLPFVVQPLTDAFAAIPTALLEAAATLRAGPWLRFWKIALPMARHGVLTATLLGFAHTLGEFGIVLMVGGNIPGKTQLLSVQLYNHVEALEYPQAHTLAGGLLAFSFLALLVLYRIRNRRPAHG